MKSRKRVKVIHYIKTDKAEYFIYNTEKTPDDDIEIEIERRDMNLLSELLFQLEIEEEFSKKGYFSRHVENIRDLHLFPFIENSGELIIETKLVDYDKRFFSQPYGYYRNKPF
jgi:hypothetical protein